MINNIYLKKLLKYENKFMNANNQIEKTRYVDKINILLYKINELNISYLSEKQIKIINSNKKNMLVIACPGSGKTHTLISRYIHLMVNDIYKPNQVLLITFTKKAGAEMIERLTSMTSNIMLPYYVGSLHGLGYKLLSKNYNSQSIILDDNDTKDLINNIIMQVITDNNIIQIMLKKFQSALDYACTNYPVDFSQALHKFNLLDYAEDFINIYKHYKKYKIKENLLDFNDLMIKLCEYLESENSIHFKNKIKYIFFDEYQDVNPIQNRILLLLSKYANIMVVGDDSQSIYSFRGSSINHILNYDKDFVDSKKYLLTDNYRSTNDIVELCQNIITNNTNKYDKQVISKNDKYDYFKPTIIEFYGRQKQYDWVVKDIINKKNNNINLSDIVILAKKNQSIDDIEILLNNNNISCVKNNNTSLLNKSYIKNIISLLQIKYSKNNLSILWKRILKLHGLEDKINDNYIENINNYLHLPNIDLLCNIFSSNENNVIDDIINYICKVSVESSLKSNMLDDINSFLSLIDKTSSETILQSINKLYLNHTDIVSDCDAIELSTIHGSKGLEWKYVYIIDMNSKDYPKSRALHDCEEERRLFYVASSRAKHHLYITYHVDNSEKINCSPFIKEINKELYDFNIYNS
jgi:DNA helicase-2/ATP-dependent DNA helicase PcrA